MPLGIFKKRTEKNFQNEISRVVADFQKEVKKDTSNYLEDYRRTIEKLNQDRVRELMSQLGVTKKQAQLELEFCKEVEQLAKEDVDVLSGSYFVSCAPLADRTLSPVHTAFATVVDLSADAPEGEVIRNVAAEMSVLECFERACENGTDFKSVYLSEIQPMLIGVIKEYDSLDCNEKRAARERRYEESRNPAVGDPNYREYEAMVMAAMNLQVKTVKNLSSDLINGSETG